MKVEVELVMEECANCSIIFGVTKDFQQRRKKDHESFFCPRAHGQNYPGKSDEEKLRDELTQERTKTTALQQQLDKTTMPRKRGRPRKWIS
jgi:hypothetical protein